MCLLFYFWTQPAHKTFPVDLKDHYIMHHVFSHIAYGKIIRPITYMHSASLSIMMCLLFMAEHAMVCEREQ